MIPTLSSERIEQYLGRLGLASRPQGDLDGLRTLIDAHLRRVPMENLDVFFQRGISVDPLVAVDKIVDDNRGGWCFELNGAFSVLLASLGFDVRLLGAAVLSDGPTQVVDHLCLEVMVDQPYLVDVGFGDGPARPLALNGGDTQDAGNASYVFMPSPQGTTLVRIKGDGLVPEYRFRRVALKPEDVAPASDAIYANPLHRFRTQPLMTRLLDQGYDRVTLTDDRLRVTVDGEMTVSEVGEAEWPEVVERWFPGLGAGLR